MKIMDVKDQVSLSFGKCVELVLSGIKYRLFRAAVTVVIISLAVAFLMTMLTESFVARRVADQIDLRMAPRRTFDFWTSRIAAPLAEQNLILELARATRDDPRWREFRAWGGLNDQRMDELVDVAGKQLPYQRFFDGLDEGKLRPLFGRTRGVEVFRRLQDEGAYRQFEEEFRTLGLKMHASLDEFKAFLGDWKKTEPMRLAILEGNGKALSSLRGKLSGQEPTAVLAEADQALPKLLADHGFQMDANELQMVKQQARLSLDADRLSRLLSIGRIKNRLADRRNADLATIDATMYFGELSTSGGAEWFRDQVADLARTIKDLEKSLPEDRAALAGLETRAAALDEKILRLQAAATQKAKDMETLKAQAAKAPASDEAIKASLKEAEQADAAAKADVDAAEKEYKELREGKSDKGAVLAVGLDDLRQRVKRDSETATSLLPARANIETFGLTSARIAQVAANRMEQKKLSEIEASVSRAAGESGGLLGYSSRTMWLIAVSFVVCVVGIANAMLMSVTDRFREIATMKCLGATDAYIMINFILESCLQGTAGGIVGAVLGFLLGAMRSLASYGWIAMQHLPWELIGVTAAAALIVGVVLSALAAVYPAWIAARLAPMEAMRIE